MNDAAGVCVGVLAICIYVFFIWLFSGGRNEHDEFGQF